MSASDPRRRLAAIGFAALLASASCDDPTASLPAQEIRKVRVLVILDPDWTTTPVLVQRVLPGSLPDVFAEIRQNDMVLATQSRPDSLAERELDPCLVRYGTIIDNARCLNFTFRPQAGATYTVRVASSGQDTATGTTTVPGAFRILSHSKEGTLPGTIRLRATWTPSAGAHRYVIAIRGRQDIEDNASCGPDTTCYPRWYVTTADTTLDEAVDERFFEEAVGPFYLDIYAMNEDLYSYLMTGNSDLLFPVPPKQNVTGGLGAVGAWTVRWRLIQQ